MSISDFLPNNDSTCPICLDRHNDDSKLCRDCWKFVNPFMSQMRPKDTLSKCLRFQAWLVEEILERES